MPLPKIKGSSAADATKADDGNDSLDTFIKQAIGKEPFLSFPRANDSPVQWIHLLHALDQQDLPGWPLLSPLKIQMQKCEKCSREFCSTINYRRHMRLHRRNLNLDKDSTTKNRGLLQAFWDKLSMEETMEIMSFNDVCLEGVTGSSIVKALTSFIRKPGFTSLPQSYIRAGSALLDIVQARPSRFPMSSQELFSILDDASEKTFLCAGTAESLQKYVFDGEAGKIGLEMRNLVACTSFLVEQKLVKACLADKDAEALRYQKLLVEEEEAAQKRQAALLEKKRQKKLRQKEQRAKEQASAETDDCPEDSSPTPPISGLVDEPDLKPEISEIPHSLLSLCLEPVQVVNLERDVDKDHENGYPVLASCQHIEHRALHRNGRRHLVNCRWQGPKLARSVNGFHGNHNYQAVKPGGTQKHVSYRDSRTATAVNSGKVWTPKPKSETDEDSHSTRLQVHAENQPTQDKRCEVLIGSISVTLANRANQQQDENLGGVPESCAVEHQSDNGVYDKPDKVEAIAGSTNRSTVKLWRPVSRHDNGGQVSVRNCNGASEAGVPCNEAGEVQLAGPAECTSSIRDENSDSSVGDLHQGVMKFSSYAAEAFLAKRWKEAIASDHVKLVLFPEPKPPPGCPEVQDDNQETVPVSKLNQRSVLSSTENRLPGYTTVESSAAMKSKMRAKPDKGSKVKYIPKQRSTT